MTERRMWMIRAGKDGTPAYPHFRDCSVAAIGWDKLGDLRQRRYRSEDQLLEAIRKKWEERPHMHVKYLKTLRCFRDEIQVGDRIVTYSRPRRVYSVGSMDGEYRYDPSFCRKFPLCGKFPQTRRVQWREPEISRDDLSDETQDLLCRRTTIFPVPQEFADEILRALAASR